MSLLKLFIVGIIVICISTLGSLVILTIFGSLAVSFVEWLEANPAWRGILGLVGLIMIVVLYVAISKWVLKKVL